MAHIWATRNQYGDMWMEKRKGTANGAANLVGLPPFPCHVDDVEIFLSLAERFRELAEATGADAQDTSSTVADPRRPHGASPRTYGPTATHALKFDWVGTVAKAFVK